MKSILIKATPFLIVFFTINFFVYKTSPFYKQESKYSNRIDSIINSKPKVVFLGDSHSESIKLLNLSENIGNLAFGADGIKEMYIKTLILKKYNPELKYVFISTEPQMFNNSISSNSTFLNKYLLKLNNSKEIYNKSKLNLITEKIPLLNDNYLRYFLNNIYSIIRNGGNKSDNNTSIKWTDISSSEKEKIASSTGITDHNGIMTRDEDLEIYKKLVNNLKLRNVKVIGVRFPVNEHYLKQCNKEDLDKVNLFINELNLDQNLDYSLSLNSATYFENEDHLNKTGMEELSKLIYKDTGIDLNK
ncbi:hypothetical protein EYD45_01205 [Hyunsoonleella flava]|uniref:SGNH/GDSL hydrolase family protein n=1 Tax=Hyunsoonleella flava TaxID=2527939 RepID=A0A4Q9FLK5_9FLAO|nr:hypothetical protein [Hyunsoonleella flava]TBN06530.1 hypothetical protein EYD45_01205 [Hyunsoonleella flava]